MRSGSVATMPPGPRRLQSRSFPEFELAVVDYPARLVQERHDHAHSNVTLVLRGSLEEHAHQARHCAAPLSVVVKPAGLMHANCFGAVGARTLSITLAAGGSLAARVDYRWWHGGEVAALALKIYRELLAGDQACDASIEALLHEIVTPPRREPDRHHRPSWLDVVLERLHETSLEAPRVRDLAAIVPVHPVYLARVFRRHLGCTVGAYLRRSRLQWAGRALMASTMPLAEVALRAGFADQSHFTRAFKTHTGFAPGQLRRSLAP